MSGSPSLLKSEQIRLVLADEITSGTLRPGQPLDEQLIAQRFTTSRTPVREALRGLTVAGLVETRPRRGVVVSQVKPEQVLDMWEMTAEMEAMCVRLATYRITPLERCHLQQVHNASAVLVQSGDYAAYDACNLAFHEAIYNATHNNYMIKTAIELRIQMAAFRRIQLRSSGRIESSHEEHEGILIAMSRGDGDEAARLMRAHLLHGASTLDQYLNNSSGNNNARR